MLQVLGVVVAIGLADSMNPSTVGPALYLATGEDSARRVLEFTLGACGVYFVAGVILVFGPGHALLSLIPHPGPRIRYWSEVVAGVVLGGIGTFVWRRRGLLAQRGLPGVKKRGKSSVLLGVSIMVIELPTAIPYFAAVAAIVGSRAATLAQLVLLAIYNVCFALPLLLIVVAMMIGGECARRLLLRGRDLLRRLWPQVLAIALICVSAFVVALGVTGLLGAGRGRLARSAHHLHRLIRP